MKISGLKYYLVLILCIISVTLIVLPTVYGSYPNPALPGESVVGPTITGQAIFTPTEGDGVNFFFEGTCQGQEFTVGPYECPSESYSLMTESTLEGWRITCAFPDQTPCAPAGAYDLIIWNVNHYDERGGDYPQKEARIQVKFIRAQ
jgi:hypothetical protein